MAIKNTYNIVLPVYNAESSIGGCIDSILTQTLSDWRLLIMDDGSTDLSLDIITSYDDSRIEVFRQSNSGAYVARNNLIKHANCHYLAFIDSDDTWASDKLEKQLYIHDLGYQFVCSDAKIHAQNSSFDLTTFGKLNGLTKNIFSITDLLKHRANFIVQSSVSVNFDEYEKIGPFVEENLAADFVQWLRILENLPQKEFYYHDEPLCTYSIHGNNISSDIIKKYHSFEKSIRQVVGEFDLKTKMLIEDKLKKNQIIIAAKARMPFLLFRLAIRYPLLFLSVFLDRIKFLLSDLKIKHQSNRII